MKIYGIPNCDTVKKARRWLDDQGIAYDFHDYKKAGIDTKTLKDWCREFGHEALINKRGTTWRNLPEAARENLDEHKAIKLMQANTSVIKRPLLVSGNKRILGFDQKAYESLL